VAHRRVEQFTARRACQRRAADERLGVGLDVMRGEEFSDIPAHLVGNPRREV
jgi:hypothetical protein